MRHAWLAGLILTTSVAGACSGSDDAAPGPGAGGTNGASDASAVGPTNDAASTSPVAGEAGTTDRPTAATDTSTATPTADAAPRNDGPAAAADTSAASDMASAMVPAECAELQKCCESMTDRSRCEAALKAGATKLGGLTCDEQLKTALQSVGICTTKTASIKVTAKPKGVESKYECKFPDMGASVLNRAAVMPDKVEIYCEDTGVPKNDRPNVTVLVPMMAGMFDKTKATVTMSTAMRSVWLSDLRGDLKSMSVNVTTWDATTRHMVGTADGDWAEKADYKMGWGSVHVEFDVGVP